MDKHSKYLFRVTQEILENQCTVGIHYDTSHLEQYDMRSEISKLEKILRVPINSGRAHWLLFDIKKSFEIFEKSGIKIDTTGGYADLVGFRFGTYNPFRPFNFKTGKTYNLIEVPLVVMEGTLMQNKYMNLDSADAHSKALELLDKVEKYNGVYTFLWHNTSFDNSEWNVNWVCESLLMHAKRKNFVFVTSDDIYNYYNKVIIKS